MRILEPNEFLDDFLLLLEFNKLARLSKNAYKSWKNKDAARYAGTKNIFLKRACIPKRHEYAASKCEDLSGFVLASAFCSFSALAPSHLIKSNGSKLYELFIIKELCGVKFINLKAFYDSLGLDYKYYLYIEKCHYFSPTPLEKRIKLTPTMCVGYY